MSNATYRASCLAVVHQLDGMDRIRGATGYDTRRSSACDMHLLGGVRAMSNVSMFTCQRLLAGPGAGFQRGCRVPEGKWVQEPGKDAKVLRRDIGWTLMAYRHSKPRASQNLLEKLCAKSKSPEDRCGTQRPVFPAAKKLSDSSKKLCAEVLLRPMSFLIVCAYLTPTMAADRRPGRSHCQTRRQDGCLCGQLSELSTVF